MSVFLCILSFVLLCSVVGCVFLVVRYKSLADTFHSDCLALRAESKNTATLLQTNNNEIQNLTGMLGERNGEVRSLRESLDKLEHQCVAMQNELNQYIKKEASLAERERALMEMAEKNKDTFYKMANEIIQNKVEMFGKQAATAKDSFAREVIRPCIERLEGQFKMVRDEFESHKAAGNSLRGLMERSLKEYTGITKALSGNIKHAGAWGEMMLINILESAGMRKNVDFFVSTQNTAINDGGRRLIPDVVINVPEDKCIIIDSKMPIQSYRAYLEHKDKNPDIAAAALKDFNKRVRDHVNDLSNKKYHEHVAGDKLTIDYTLMFLPLADYYDVIEAQLFQEAQKKGVLIVGPTTIIPIVITLGNMLNVFLQNKNTQKLLELFKDVYKKINGMFEEMDRMARYLNGAVSSYNNIVEVKIQGRGGIESKMRTIADMGMDSGGAMSAYGELKKIDKMATNIDSE